MRIRAEERALAVCTCASGNTPHIDHGKSSTVRAGHKERSHARVHLQVA